MSNDAFCWVNRVGMPHEWKRKTEGLVCQRCGKVRKIMTLAEAKIAARQLQIDHDKSHQEWLLRESARESLWDSNPENEGQNA